MKRFSSYGPPHPDIEFMVQRPALVQQVVDQLIGTPEEGGHFFTVFAPRQVGKTTTLRQAVALLRETLGDSFQVGMTTLHLIRDFRKSAHEIFLSAFGLTVEPTADWEACKRLFLRQGPLKKPTILILDEFDGLDRSSLNETIELFRQIYLQRNEYQLHGLALIGVHAVLGDVTSTMSPFNIQRSVNIPSLTHDEVVELYQQYQDESGQRIEPEGVERIYDMLRGQPGLTCWFGELLTEKYNPCQPPPCRRKEGPPPEGYPLITRARVDRVLIRAQYSEINVNTRNLISKGLQHQALLRKLFVSHHMRFDLNIPELQWLYLNGILVADEAHDSLEEPVCAFASPFVQRCLFSAFGRALNDAYGEAQLTVDVDAMALKNAIRGLDVPLMLRMYRQFLGAQTAKGEAPWMEQPSRTDARAFEAIGHFNLYAWLYGVAKGTFAVVPEFPTGNGTADLLLTNTTQGVTEVLEIKSFTNTSDLDKAVEQAARYARKLKLVRSYLVVMTDVSAYELLRTAPTQYEVLGVTVRLEVIPWGFWPGGQPHVTGTESSAFATPAGADLVPRASQSAKISSSVLSIRDRITLDALIAPHLTPIAFRILRGSFGLEPGGAEDPLIVAWQALRSTLEAQGLVAELLLAVEFALPGVADHPLLASLKHKYGG